MEAAIQRILSKEEGTTCAVMPRSTVKVSDASGDEFLVNWWKKYNSWFLCCVVVVWDDVDDVQEADPAVGESSSDQDEAESPRSSDGEEEHDVETPCSSDDGDRVPKGFLEGGKIDSFSRAFQRIVEGAGDGHRAPPILAGSKSIHKMKEEEEKELEASKAAKRLRDEMKRRGHHVPMKRGMDPDRDGVEKRLQKTATKGVVQLFNAINAAQKRIRNEETKGNRGKIARLGKAGFLAEMRHLKDMEGKAEMASRPMEEVPGDKDESRWDVLKEGFVGIGQDTSARMKDWDKKTGDSSPEASKDGSIPTEDDDSEGF